jgi:hypothetical protein
MQKQVEKMIEKLEHLSPERISEVADFIEFLQQKDEERNLGEDFAKISEESFEQIWDNDDDAAYDAL